MNGNNGTNGYATAGAGTPAAAQAVTIDHHSNTDDRSKTMMTVVPAADDIAARFMPVMAIEQAIARRQAIVDATTKLMRKDVDFGKVPGTDRETLLQPGADKLCNLFGLVVQYEVVKSEEDWTGERHGGCPFFFYEIKGRAYRGEHLMGEGVGSCSSWESKYRWRKAERTCPQCGKANIRKSKNEGGWYCWTRTDGCGATFAATDPAIVSQETGRRPNPDMADIVNTILKMAYKRCKVSTTINATSASEFFTQDVEDQGSPEDDDPRGYNVDTSGAPYGTREAQENVANRRIAELRGDDQARRKWTNTGEMKRMFEAVREKAGENVYLSELGRFGVRKAEEFRNDSAAWSCYNRLVDLSAREVA